ncbi:vesicular integral-membrane protein VIP36-like [Sycon ciliatum]|uniref:vesicular integral-membrane protein VIP36-like n=1 Tax=Sycon ciliatum TaxID=27933 RepID=UPI0020AAD231|eukprot:scpid65731/ scgid33683/ VIP36-like protein; Lectin mannose-binding 2-like
MAMSMMKMRWHEPLVFLVVLCSLVGAQDGNQDQDGGSDYLRREHSLVKPYTGTGMDIPLWDFGGSTVVSNEYIRLTPDRQSKQGHLWNQVPNHMRHWEIRVSFMVHGAGRSLYGDGFGIWYAKDRMQFGNVFGNQDKFSGLGVFLDTYSNFDGDHAHLHPYISAMVNNGSLNYDHDHDGTHGQLDGCSVAFRNADYQSHISISYFQGTLSVYTRVGTETDWKSCLNVAGISLPTGYYFGFTATTGDLADNHDIVMVKTYELFPSGESDKDAEVPKDLENIVPAAAHQEAPREHVESTKPTRKSSMAMYFLVLGGILALGLIGGGVFYYKKQQEKARKRFF